MLTFTGSGAVSSPTTVQIRVTRAFPGRVPAGAPSPERSLSAAEVRANLDFFTEGMRGPRTRPCTALVLSGVGLDRADGLADAVARGRDQGIERVTLHVGHGQRDGLSSSDLFPLVDAVAMTVEGQRDLDDLAALDGRFRTAVVLLSEARLPQLPELCRGLARVAPERAVFTWPFPPSAPPPPAADAVAALSSSVAALGALPWGIKGLPACRLGDMRERLWRSGNRWYVDADHQRDEALLFFPDVVRFLKADDCRYCAFDDRCDGAPADWLRAGLAGTLEPLSD